MAQNVSCSQPLERAGQGSSLTLTHSSRILSLSPSRHIHSRCTNSSDAPFYTFQNISKLRHRGSPPSCPRRLRGCLLLAARMAPVKAPLVMEFQGSSFPRT